MKAIDSQTKLINERNNQRQIYEKNKNSTTSNEKKGIPMFVFLEKLRKKDEMSNRKKI